MLLQSNEFDFRRASAGDAVQYQVNKSTWADVKFVGKNHVKGGMVLQDDAGEFFTRSEAQLRMRPQTLEQHMRDALQLALDDLTKILAERKVGDTTTVAAIRRVLAMPRADGS